jgi:serine/threonine-protein kinase
MAILLGIGLYLLIGSEPKKAITTPPRVAPAHSRRPVVETGGVVPKQPGPLAVGSNGSLYVADDSLNEVLQRLPSGMFVVVAGDGKAGFSGDGGPAINAELDGPQGMVVGSNGTIYVADAGNNRVRAILPDGIITTVAGNGQSPQSPDDPQSGQIATEADIGSTAVAIGPNGSLYVAGGNAVEELEANGTLATVADASDFLGVDQRFPQSPQCDPDGLAFDGSGDLFMTCSNINDLLERTAGGEFVYRGILRPHDANAALTSSPDGAVIGLWQSSMYRFTGSADSVVANFRSVPGVGDFWPQGVAVAPDGTIYVDQDGDSGIGPPAIVAYLPNGTSSRLWSQPNSQSK